MVNDFAHRRLRGADLGPLGPNGQPRVLFSALVRLSAALEGGEGLVPPSSFPRRGPALAQQPLRSLGSGLLRPSTVSRRRWGPGRGPCEPPSVTAARNKIGPGDADLLYRAASPCSASASVTVRDGAALRRRPLPPHACQVGAQEGAERAAPFAGLWPGGGRRDTRRSRRCRPGPGA